MKDGRALLSLPLGRVRSGRGLHLDAAVTSIEAGISSKVGVALSTAVTPHAVRRCWENQKDYYVAFRLQTLSLS